MIIPLINCATSVYAGFVVFAILGYLAHETGLPIDNVVEQGTVCFQLQYCLALTKSTCDLLASRL